MPVKTTKTTKKTAPKTTKKKTVFFPSTKDGSPAVVFTVEQGRVVDALYTAENASVACFDGMEPAVAFAGAFVYLKIPFVSVREARKSSDAKVRAALRLYQKLSTRKARARARSTRDPLVSLLTQLARADGTALAKTLASHELRESVIAQCRLMIK